MFKPTKMNITLYKNTKKYGDRDLDGSMNYRDCDSRRADRDGLLSLALHKISKGTYGQSKSDFLAERKLKQKLAQKRKLAMLREKILQTEQEAKRKLKRKVQVRKNLRRLF